MNHRDHLICGVCRGTKVIRKVVQEMSKVDICPKCNGNGYLSSSKDLQERDNNKKQVLLKG
jgi:DnaJ-class molecular chaperone